MTGKVEPEDHELIKADYHHTNGGLQNFPLSVNNKLDSINSLALTTGQLKRKSLGKSTTTIHV